MPTGRQKEKRKKHNHSSPYERPHAVFPDTPKGGLSTHWGQTRNPTGVIPRVTQQPAPHPGRTCVQFSAYSHAARVLAPGAVRERKRDTRREKRTRNQPECANREALPCAGACPALRSLRGGKEARGATPHAPRGKSAAAPAPRCRPSPWASAAPTAGDLAPPREGSAASLRASPPRQVSGRYRPREAAGGAAPRYDTPPPPHLSLSRPSPGGAGLSPGISAALVTLAVW